MRAGDQTMEASDVHPSSTAHQGQATLSPPTAATLLMKNVINKWADEFGSDKWGTRRTLCISDSDLIHLAGVDVD